MIARSTVASNKRLRALIAEKYSRKQEPLKQYRPLSQQRAFHESEAFIRLAIGSNRSGKTLISAVEFARAVLGMDPFGKYPKEGTVYVVGKSLAHIADTIYRKLCLKGFIRIIPKGDDSGEWEVYQPWRPEHRERFNESKESGPLIPKRFIKRIKFEDVGKNEVSSIEFTTGWVARFFSARGLLPQGAPADLCLAGHAEVFDPVAKIMRRVDQIDSSFHVESYNEKTGAVETRMATRPFIKNHGPLCDVRLSNGKVLNVTREHRILTASGEWMSVSKAYLKRTPILSRRASTGFCDGQQSSEPSPVKCHTHEQSELYSPCVKAKGTSLSTEPRVVSRSIFRDCEGASDQPSNSTITNCPVRYSCRLCGERSRGEKGIVQESIPSQVDARQHTRVYHTVGAKASKPEHNHHESEYLTACFSMPCPSVGRCESESHLCEGCDSLLPLGSQTLLRPLGSCSRKRTACKYFRSQNDQANSLAPVGESESPPLSAIDGCSGCGCGNISSNNRRLDSAQCKGDEEQICLVNGEEAASNVSDFDELLFIDSLEDAGDGLIWDFGVEVNHNYMYGSVANHNCWLDEEIVDSQDGAWVPEMIARLTDRKGRMIWSATPQNGFANLLEMSDRADRQLEMWLANPKDNPKPDVVRFDLKIDENAYQDKEAVDRFRRSLSEEDLAIRFGGMSMINSIRVYPEWQLSIHGYPLRKTMRHWTHYAIIDPGHSICAVLFCAVPPPEESPSGLNIIIAFDELYIPQCNAAMFGQAMYEKVLGQPYESFIIDGHGARPTEAGSGYSIEEQYSRALKGKGVKSQSTGNGFVYGDDDRAAGVLTVHEFLMKRDGAPPRFVVATNPDDPSQPLCPILHSEMVRYKKKRVNGLVVDEPYDRGPTHLCQCVRYICRYRPEWVEYQGDTSGFDAWVWKNKFPSFMGSNNRNNANTVNLGCGP